MARKLHFTTTGVAGIFVRGGTLLGLGLLGGPGAEPPGRWRIFENIPKKIGKIHYFSIFFKAFNKPCLNFSRVWRKTTMFWVILRNVWKCLIILKRKIDFWWFLERSLLKMEHSEITSHFYNKLSMFAGMSPLPLATPLTIFLISSFENLNAIT